MLAIRTAAFFLLVLGCSTKGESRRHGPGDDHKRAVPEATPTGVAIEFAGRSIHLQAREISGRRSLESLVAKHDQKRNPWKLIEARSGVRTLSIELEHYADSEIDLYVSESEICIGIFRSASDNAPQHVQEAAAKAHLKLCGLDSINIRMEVEEKKRFATGYTPLKVKLGGGKTVEIKEMQVMGLTPVASFHSRHKNADRIGKQFHLKDVLALVSAPLRGNHVSVHSATESLEIPTMVLRSSDFRPVLKYNRRGEWNYRLYARRRPEALTELRGVTRVEIE